MKPGGAPTSRKAWRTLTRTAFDTPPWRSAETLQRWGRDGRRRLRAKRPGARPDPSPAARDQLLRAIEGRRLDDDADSRAQALAYALRDGGVETAFVLARSIAGDPSRLAPDARGRTLPLVLQALLAAGATAVAHALAEEHRRELDATSGGRTQLYLLDRIAFRPPASVVLPDGSLNAMAVSELADTGHLAPDRVLGLLLRRPHHLLERPELHLLAHTAFRNIDRAFATAALNRFLRTQRLPACDDTGASGHLLRDLRTDAPARKRRPGADPLVSVIVAARNTRETIGYALESILAQTHDNLELLVCDDASTDGTAELLAREYAGKPRVRLFRSAAHQGTYNIRNHLLPHVRGELVTFQDADDVSLPTRIESQVRRLLESDAVATVTSWIRVTPEGRFVFFKDHSAVRLAHVSLMTRPELLRRLGGYRSVWFGADQETYERLEQLHGPGSILRLREPHLFGLWSKASLTRRPGWESLEDGYRGPARRRYSELLFRQRLLGREALSDTWLTDELHRCGNHAAPRGVVEVASDAVAPTQQAGRI